MTGGGTASALPCRGTPVTPPQYNGRPHRSFSAALPTKALRMDPSNTRSKQFIVLWHMCSWYNRLVIGGNTSRESKATTNRAASCAINNHSNGPWSKTRKRSTAILPHSILLEIDFTQLRTLQFTSLRGEQWTSKNLRWAENKFELVCVHHLIRDEQHDTCEGV